MVNQSAEPNTVLVVDDDPTFRQLAEAHLTKAGYRVTLAGDGVRALMALQSNRFKLAIIDLSMPRIDGFRLIGLIRGDTRLRHMKIVVVSGTLDPRDLEEALAIGANASIAKPIDWHRFAGLIANAIAPKAA